MALCSARESFTKLIQPFSNRQILDSSKLKDFVDEDLQFDEILAESFLNR